jgi:hypothetical protein
MPVTTLMSVVFPEPFGPMTAWTVPGSIATSTCESADTPPNRFVTARMSRIGPRVGAAMRPLVETRRSSTRRGETADEGAGSGVCDVVRRLMRATRVCHAPTMPRGATIAITMISKP